MQMKANRMTTSLARLCPMLDGVEHNQLEGPEPDDLPYAKFRTTTTETTSWVDLASRFG